VREQQPAHRRASPVPIADAVASLPMALPILSLGTTSLMKAMLSAIRMAAPKP
jgi:hypothetical protein